MEQRNPPFFFFSEKKKEEKENNNTLSKRQLPFIYFFLNRSFAERFPPPAKCAPCYQNEHYLSCLLHASWFDIKVLASKQTFVWLSCKSSREGYHTNGVAEGWCYFVLFWGRRPHQQIYFSIHLSFTIQLPPPPLLPLFIHRKAVFRFFPQK